MQRLVEDGLTVHDLDVAYKELLAIDAVSPKSQESILSFARQEGFDLSKVARALAELKTPLPFDFKIPTTPCAKEILAFFHSTHTLALVTGGYPPFQREKMEKAGLDSAIFSRIAIPEDSVKKPFYSHLAKEFSMVPDQIWVCGDRVEMDLIPAQELGFKTVHMRWGRGARGAKSDKVDYSIASLPELKRIIL